MEPLCYPCGASFGAYLKVSAKFGLPARSEDFAAQGWQEGLHYNYLNSDAGYGDAVTPSQKALIRQGNSYVRRILENGERPGDLPIQQPSKFELTINRRTAAAIGLELPKALVLQADEVID